MWVFLASAPKLPPNRNNRKHGTQQGPEGLVLHWKSIPTHFSSSLTTTTTTTITTTTVTKSTTMKKNTWDPGVQQGLVPFENQSPLSVFNQTIGGEMQWGWKEYIMELSSENAIQWPFYWSSQQSCKIPFFTWSKYFKPNSTRIYLGYILQLCQESAFWEFVRTLIKAPVVTL